MNQPRRRTATSNFGSGARESHDAAPFHARFRSPGLSTDDRGLEPVALEDPFVHGDARRMTRVADGSVALVVTSSPCIANLGRRPYRSRLAPAPYAEGDHTHTSAPGLWTVRDLSPPTPPPAHTNFGRR